MTDELRPVTSDEFADWARTVDRAFGHDLTDEAVERWRRVIELDRTLAVLEDGRITGTAAIISFTMSLPDAEPVPCAGVTAVAVELDRRRRGLLDRMMRRQLDDVRDRGEAFAALYASESPIYGRWGYGMAAPVHHLRIETAHARLRRTADRSIVTAAGEAGRAAIPAVHDAYRRQRGGMMSRSDARWQQWLDDRQPDTLADHRGVRVLLVVGDRGYLSMRVTGGWGDAGPAGRADVTELVALDPEALAALYDAALHTDLVAEVRFGMRPADDPLAHLLRYRGRLVERVGEGLYLRLVDVRRALEARGYRADGHLVIDVHDAVLDANTGRYLLEVGGGGATCTRTDAPADLELDVRDLAAIVIGGVTATGLVWSGDVVEHRAGAAARADRLLAVDLAPWNPFIF